jgi:small subunit ribosomal protein S1
MEVEGRPTDATDDGYWQSLLREAELADTPAPRPGTDELPISSDGRTANSGLLDSTWQWAQEVFAQDSSVEGIVTSFNRGGLLVRVPCPNGGDLPGFVPASHMVGLTRWVTDQDRVNQLGGRVGEQLRLKVIELNREQNRFILSERLAMGRQKDGERLLQTLKVGDSTRGKVNHLTEFGAFVDLGGIDGLIHVSEISWERVSHPKDLLRLGQEVQVLVISIDAPKRRIQLSIKRLRPDPWIAASQKYEVGQTVEGIITNVTDFGAFAKVDDGLEGLIHASELAEGDFLHPRAVVHEGDHVQARIVSIDGARHRLALTLRNSR